jgi:formylglycine-generating enzyme required for sulfatase activity
MGAALTQAQNWLAKRSEDLPGVDQEFIDQSVARESKARARARQAQALIYVLLIGIIAGLVGWINQSYVMEQWNWLWTMRPYMLAQVRPYVLTAEKESTLVAGDTFRECAKDCPEMIVVPAGEFTMGSPPKEKDLNNESPQHKVRIAKPFAVSKFDVTFADWDTCVSVRGCPQVKETFGRGMNPVINVSWDDSQQYVAWLSRMTGQPYRLLTEAEWEYAARAGTTTAYYWGDAIGVGNANCKGCSRVWDGRTSEVGTFNPNAFGLYDMAGNANQWVEDCYHDNYDDAPTDGSARTAGNCVRRVVRGGSWYDNPPDLRSAYRFWDTTTVRIDNLGFRVGRTLLPP